MTRKKELDILKGLAIILMVLGHTNFWGKPYIYLFHMAVFFMASGYFFKNESTSDYKNLGQYIKKKIIALWLPYFIWNSVFIVCNNLFIKINFYTNDPHFLEEVNGGFNTVHTYMSVKETIMQLLKSFLFVGGTTMGGAFWFLRILFEISIIYAVVNFILLKLVKSERRVLIAQGIVALFMLILGYFCSLKNISFAGNSQISFSCYCLFYIGKIISVKNITIENKIVKGAALLLSMGILLVCNMYGSVSLGSNYYVNPIFLLIVSILGWILLYEISSLLLRFTKIKTILIYIGQNTISIVVFHFLAFKLISYLQVIIYSKPRYLIAAFPVLYNFGGWWIAYTIVGVIIPLLINFIWRKIICLIKK